MGDTMRRLLAAAPPAGVDGPVPVRQVQAAQVHVLPDADALRRRAHDHVRHLRQLRQPLEVLVRGCGRGTCVRGSALTRVLADWSLPPSDIYAVYPERLNLSAKVRVFIDFLREYLERNA